MLAGNSATCLAQSGCSARRGFHKGPFSVHLSCPNSSLSQMMLWTMRTARQYTRGNSSKGKVCPQLLFLCGDGGQGQSAWCTRPVQTMQGQCSHHPCLEFISSPILHHKYLKQCANCDTLLQQDAALLGHGVCHTQKGTIWVAVPKPCPWDATEKCCSSGVTSSHM